LILMSIGAGNTPSISHGKCYINKEFIQQIVKEETVTRTVPLGKYLKCPISSIRCLSINASMKQVPLSATFNNVQTPKFKTQSRIALISFFFTAIIHNYDKNQQIVKRN